ncbi:MAG: TIGR02646 family protein [bacterium]|nr:TIGR02646 family protein [bacterium]
MTFPTHWRRPDVRGALHAMHGRVCAYCQCSLGRSRGDVEHFRPSSVYWWLAYNFDNYFLSCHTCNRERKIGRFPLEPGTRPVTFATREELGREARLLLDPTEDPVEEWLRTDFEDDLCRIENRVDAAAHASAWAQVEETIRLFRLNLDQGLLRERQEAVDTALELLEDQKSDPAARMRLRRMASRFSPHGISVRTILEAFAPELLPSPGEELRWLCDDFLAELERLRALLTEADDAFLRRDAEEICWALAILWKDPPPDMPLEEVETWLQDAGVYHQVRTHYDRV